MKDKVYKVDINPKDDGYQTESASMVYKIFEKKIGLVTSWN